MWGVDVIVQHVQLEHKGRVLVFALCYPRHGHIYTCLQEDATSCPLVLLNRDGTVTCPMGTSSVLCPSQLLSPTAVTRHLSADSHI